MKAMSIFEQIMSHTWTLLLQEGMAWRFIVHICESLL